MRRVATATITIATFLFLGSAAQADIMVCNDFRARIRVAFAFQDQRNFPASGWWSVKPNACQTIDFAFQGSTLYYAADSDDYKDGRTTNHDHWGNKVKLFVAEKKFDFDNADNPRRGAIAKMFSSYVIPQPYLGKPLTITFHFISGSTSISVKTSQ